ncbi:hypothetical protein MTR67_007032 [Solanum verrucosum]|uniref:Gag-pol polyprotein n=1 Tax=Solanum verrucosum TaxID=315347 RepID=A0AAF0PZ34_SOLVR|nr:hypothetical protein MTR67_007032 [Solanum verrucosum]
MPPRRAVKGRPARRNVEEQGVPNALEVQPQGEEVADSSRIRELLRMNSPSFTCSSVPEDPENFIEELKRLFEF